jgi:hypothetical protein
MWRRTVRTIRNAEQAAEHAHRTAALRREARLKLDRERRKADDGTGTEPEMGLLYGDPGAWPHRRRPDQTWSRH